MKKQTKLKYEYPVGAIVFLRHAGALATGVVSHHTQYKAAKANAKPKPTYTIKGHNGIIYPLVGVDGTMEFGNILSKCTAAQSFDVLNDHNTTDPEVDSNNVENNMAKQLKIKTLKDLREMCKKNNIPYNGSKEVVIEKLIKHAIHKSNR